MTIKGLLFLLLFSPFLLSAQDIISPLEKKNYSQPTNYSELTEYINSLENKSELLRPEIIGTTLKGKNIYALKFSKSKFGKDKSKIKVLIFAQQHGNEQSGKEGALLLIADLLKPKNQYLFDKIDLAIIPQVNADGSEINQRRNGRNVDLNRNHLILEEPEVIALHQFFDKYLFEITMDIHEYSPYSSKAWKRFGYRTNSDELIGVNTNCNISVEMRDFANTTFVPFYRDYLTKAQITNSIYAPGGPPEADYIRHSTFDINDGRQSFGIQGTFSVIQEGLNGEDDFKSRIQRRAFTQASGMLALLEFAYQNSAKVKKLVSESRQKLINSEQGEDYSIQMEHVETGKILPLPVYSYSTGKDSVIMVKNYRPSVKSIYDIKTPAGYLIPKNIPELDLWSKRQNLNTKSINLNGYIVEQYSVVGIDSLDFEGDMVGDPNVQISVLSEKPKASDYIFIPINQLKMGLIISALEPKSELGLVTYSGYRHLLKSGGKFPILRVVKK